MKKLLLSVFGLFFGFGAMAQTLDYTFITVGCNRVDPIDFKTVSYDTSSTANIYALNRLFTEAMALTPQPKFLFLTGDLVMGYRADTTYLANQLKGWKALYYAHPISTSGIKVVVIPGNHETQDKAAGKKSSAALERTFVREMKDFIVGNNGPQATGLVAGTDSLTTDQSQLTYSFNYKNDHFLILDTDPKGRDSRLPYHWIKNDLAAAQTANTRHTFAFGHKPAYSSKFKPKDGLEAYTVLRDSFWVALENNHVEAMFAAHEHIFDTIQGHKSKTWQVIAGNGGSAVEATWNKAPYNYHGFTLVSVYTNNEINCKSMGHDIGAHYYDEVPNNPTTLRANFSIATGAIINHTSLVNTHMSGPFNVMATITDNMAVAADTLMYWVNGAMKGKVSGTASGNDYTFVIPQQAGSGIIEYALMAKDNFGQVSYLPSAPGMKFKFAFGPVAVSKYTLNHSPLLGTCQGQNIYLAGASGLSYIQGSNNEYYTVTDRGPNLDANLNKNLIAKYGSAGAANAKLFALPNFSPQIIRLKAQGDSLSVVSATTIKRPNGTSTTGIINPIGGGGTGELAITDTTGTDAGTDIWGIDSEGIVEGINNDFWICEEYGTSVWNIEKATGKVIHRYAPFKIKQNEDLALDTVFSYRNSNKGFEGVAFAPNGKVYAFIQNTLLFPAAVDKKKTRLHRFVEIDSKTSATKMFAYEHDKVPASGSLSTIANDKRYIGDAAAINDNEFLVLEHGKSAKESYAKIYKITLDGATPITADYYGVGSAKKSLEQMADSTAAAVFGIKTVTKTLFLDLIANGYDPTIEKQEGLAIVNDSTIAIANDNDFGVISLNADGVMTPTGVKTYIYTFTVPQANKLNLCVPVKADFTQNGATLTATKGMSYQWYMNGSPVQNEMNQTYTFSVNGDYAVKITFANACDVMSDVKTLTVTSVNDDILKNTKLTVYPNPSKGNELSFSKTVSFTLYTIAGKTVKILSNVNSMSTAGLTPGLYIIKTTEGDSLKFIQE